MRLLTFIITVYAIGLLLARDTISGYISLPGGIVWLDALTAILFATAFSMIWSKGRSFAMGAIPVLMVGGAVFGATQIGVIKPTPFAAVATAPLEATLNRAWDGHFRTIARIDGGDIGVLVDTGASLILLRYDDAMRAGVNPALLDFDIPLTTASGRSYVALHQFSQVRIGGVVVRNVAGAVAMPGELHNSLLGMSFLEQLTETVIRRDAMILRQ
ncbi:MAG TPA: TIGR02281 family clan AA aspartic protease [Rhodobacteraceae bacterium]|nr:TIGR02281 family clan AA aspartic protease [Paracoccaceae bacterium]